MALQFVEKKGSGMSDISEVLFVCVQNAGRSQMAAALLDKEAEGRIRVHSAGSAPAESIHANVMEAMVEIGIDLSNAVPKPIRDDTVRAADVVITMGCGDACPVYPGKRYEDWKIDDPSGQPPERVRAIRDEIHRRVDQLIAELAPRPAAPVTVGSVKRREQRAEEGSQEPSSSEQLE